MENVYHSNGMEGGEKMVRHLRASGFLGQPAEAHVPSDTTADGRQTDVGSHSSSNRRNPKDQEEGINGGHVRVDTGSDTTTGPHQPEDKGVLGRNDTIEGVTGGSKGPDGNDPTGKVARSYGRV